MTNVGGGAFDAYFYGAWGELDTPDQLSASIDPFLFVGREGYYSDDEGIDKTTTSPNLPYCVRARFYNPLWGRWLNPDPIGFAALPNRYAYVQNNPVNAIDPSGKIAVQLGCCAGCAAWIASTAQACWTGPCANPAPGQSKVGCTAECVVNSFQALGWINKLLVGGECAVCGGAILQGAIKGAIWCQAQPWCLELIKALTEAAGKLHP